MTDTTLLATALSDRYRIERQLGSGGMATVYLAQDLKHDRQVALKVLRPELAAVIGADRFLAEIKTTANLQHPHILPLFDSGQADGSLFYVMPFVEGETVRERLTREKQLPIADAVRIAAEVASALDYAHRHGVIHRDIKPENILLHDGSALVADFGIALAASKAGGAERMTETGMSLGTPHYMSPEQAMGEREITARSDVYALGCVTYEMLLGEPPFTGPTAQTIVAKVLNEQPAPLVPRRHRIPREVEEAVLTALEKLPADRWGSAREFSAALAGEAEGKGRARSRAPLRVPAWALLGVGVMVGIVAGVLGRGRVRSDAASPVRFSLAVHLGDIDFGPGLDLSQDGSELVFIGRAPDGRPGLFRRRLGESDPVLVPATQGAIVRSPSISPDGQMVAFTSQSQLRIAALQGGTDRIVVDSISPTSGGLDWGPRDEIVFQRSFGEGLNVVASSGESPRRLTQVDSGTAADHRWPQILPNDKWVIFTIWKGSLNTASLAIVSLRGGSVRALLPGAYGRYAAAGYLVFIGPGGTLQRVEFDAGSGKVSGNATALPDSVVVSGDGSAQFALSGSGTAAFLRSIGRRVPVLVDRHGVETPLRGVQGSLYTSPRLSPDGRVFAMDDGNGSGDVWAYDLVAGTFSRVTDQGGFYPVWTADGARILYSRDEQAEVNVYNAPVNRSEARRLVLGHHGQQRTQDLSHDGRHLLLRQNLGTGHYKLLVLNLGVDSAPVPWQQTSFLERAPAFSPNDRWVAYSSDESGRDEIYVRAFPGPGGRIPVSTNGGTEPAWSRDGTELYFRTPDGLQAVRVETRGEFRVSSRPETVMRGDYYAYPWARQYDVLPDGKRFLVLRDETSSIDLTVVVNWPGASRVANGVQ